MPSSRLASRRRSPKTDGPTPQFGFDYKRAFGDHYITALVNYNQTKYFDPNLAFLVPNGYQGVVGRTTYGYKGRYLAEFTFGYNGTENFATGKRFGFFPGLFAGLGGVG